MRTQVVCVSHHQRFQVEAPNRLCVMKVDDVSVVSEHI
jgi:hypothetical protein